MNIEIETIDSIRMECNNGLNPSTFPQGSFMQLVDIKAYSWETGIVIKVEKEDCILYENFNFVPTSIIKSQLTEQAWRTMQSMVTTHLWFATEPIIL